MLTLEEARGIVAKIWMGPNYRRRVMDTQLCEDFANVLVDELIKTSVDTPEFDKLNLEFAQAKVELSNVQSRVIDFDKLRDQFASLKDHYDSLNDQYNRLKLNFANLQSDNESLKLGKKDEVV